MNESLLLNNIYPLFNQFVLTQGAFFFILVLCTPHARPLAKRFLLVFIVTQMISPLFRVSAEGITPPVPVAGQLGPFVFFLSGPAFYFYIKALRNPSLHLGPENLWHLLPACCFPLLFQGYLSFGDSNGFIAMQIGTFYTLTMMVVFFCYLVVSLRLLPGYQWFFQEVFAPKEDAIWRWLMIPTLFYVAIYLSSIISWLVNTAHSQPGMERGLLDILMMSARVIFIYLVAIGSYRHRNVYEIQGEQTLAPVSTDIPIKALASEEQRHSKPYEDHKYKTSVLDSAQAAVIWHKITDYMSTKEPFLEADLTLLQLADALEISRHQLSQVINSCSNQNFYDFVNAYRAQKAGVLIAMHARSRYAMLDIAHEAGFGNTATFYKYFKKHHAMTPAKYRQACKKN